MLDLKDFQYLPALDGAMDQVASERAGLVVVAGLDSRPHLPPTVEPDILPSGRATIFRILARRLLPEEPARRGRREAQAVVVATSKEAVRLPRALRSEVTYHLVTRLQPYEQAIQAAAQLRPRLLVVDTLNQETAPAILTAARSGLRLLSQMDTIWRGPDVARQLLEMGVAQEQLAALRWVVAVQRFPRLCPNCRRPAPLAAADRLTLSQRYPHLPVPVGLILFQAGGCDQCQGTGWQGQIAAFDVWRVDAADPLHGVSVLALEDYLWQLATAGEIVLGDLLRLEAAQVRQIYQLLTASERTLQETAATLQRKVAQLEAAHKVLQDKTEALISLHEVSQSLLGAAGLREQAHLVCVHCCALADADRAVLYYLHTPAIAQVLATHGWDPARVPARVDARPLAMDVSGHEARIWPGSPPGIPFGDPDKEGAQLWAGLLVPLVADGRPVGAMVLHKVRARRFSPGEIALLQTFANQAALAIQRAGLIEQLRDKVAILEAAQAELAQKQRLEHELALARQVQLRMLPRTFPLLPGFQFASLNEPARQVGGDFYDVLRLDDDHFGLAVADVSGKGMPAALFMALSRSLLVAEARRNHSPAAVLRAVNDLLLQLGEPDMFVTLFYGVVECRTRRLTYGRAGHERPFLLRDGLALELDGQGTVLGLLASERLVLSEEQVELRPGDRLILYSDGLTDVVATDGQMYSRQQLRALFRQYAALPPDALGRVVLAALREYQGTAEQFDDMTLLIMDVE
ncbi:MAG: SpoIIE family protein phosphatase [Chloroflexota bacterium]